MVASKKNQFNYDYEGRVIDASTCSQVFLDGLDQEFRQFSETFRADAGQPVFHVRVAEAFDEAILIGLEVYARYSVKDRG